ncbi:helix-turn-helix domain-containing protein [Nocardia takedensis]|uniref:helix-turn-helix domain-containing protein n=1 Tax=Nocardia takedensis TaxID=259390 RepID=UPI0002E33944|nr:helix-turn-helix domain-containing protein [Nocardia takedensis]
MSNNAEYLTVDQAAEYLGTGVRFIRRIVAERRVVFYKVGNHVRFKAADLEAFAQAGRVEPVQFRWTEGKAA